MHSLLYATLIAEYRISEAPVMRSPLCVALLVTTGDPEVGTYFSQFKWKKYEQFVNATLL